MDLFEQPLMQLNISVINQGGIPTLNIERKRIRDYEILKTIVSAALNEQPVTLLFSFKDKMKGLNSLVSKGIIYKDETDGGYRFSI